jgi:hypothetical protein
MTLRKLATRLAKLEGKKHEASIGDIRELLKLIVKLNNETSGDIELLLNELRMRYEEKLRNAML